MRDDSRKWQPAQGLERDPVVMDGLTIRVIQPERQALLSGPYASLLALANVTGTVGWPDPAMGDSYAIRLRRDRILAVNGPTLADGWHDEIGVAVSDMTWGYAVIELNGPAAMGVLQRGTEITLDTPSASVARRFAGHDALIYARGPDSYRLHVLRPYLDAVWGLITSLGVDAVS